MIQDRDDIVTINDEIWKLKERCLDVEDQTAGQILYQLCQIVEKAIDTLRRGE